MKTLPVRVLSLLLHDAKTDPPKESGMYFVISGNNFYGELPYSLKHQAWNTHDFVNYPEHKIEDVHYWAHKIDVELEAVEFEDAISPALPLDIRELAEKLFIAAYQTSHQIETWDNFVETERALDAAAEFYNRVRSK